MVFRFYGRDLVRELPECGLATFYPLVVHPAVAPLVGIFDPRRGERFPGEVPIGVVVEVLGRYAQEDGLLCHARLLEDLVHRWQEFATSEVTGGAMDDEEM